MFNTLVLSQDKFPNLEETKLDGGDDWIETYGGRSAEFCCNLKVLKLYRNCDKWTVFPFVTVGNEKSQPGGTFPNVEALGVSEIGRVLPFSSGSFQNLKTLEVWGCDVLSSLLTPSTAGSMEHLEKIRIFECKRMIEIVACGGSEAGDEVAFNNLSSLEFHNLPSLRASISRIASLNSHHWMM